MSFFGFSVPPGWILGFLVSGIFASSFRVLIGGKARSLWQCWGVALVGFLVGQVVAQNAGAMMLDLPMVGDVHILPAALGSIVLVVLFGRR